MSVLGNIGRAVGKAVKDTGHFVGSVADNKYTKIATAAALAATGVGAPAAAGIMAAEGGLGGALKKGGNLKNTVTKAAGGALEGYGASKLGSLARGAMGIGGGSASGEAAEQGGSSFLGKLGGLAKDAGNGLLGAAKGLVKNPDGSINWGNILKGGAAGMGLLGQHQATNASNDYFNKLYALHAGQLDKANAEYDKRAPMRDAASAAITAKLNPTNKNIFSKYLGG